MVVSVVFGDVCRWEVCEFSGSFSFPSVPLTCENLDVGLVLARAPVELSVDER